MLIGTIMFLCVVSQSAKLNSQGELKINADGPAKIVRSSTGKDSSITLKVKKHRATFTSGVNRKKGSIKNDRVTLNTVTRPNANANNKADKGKLHIEYTSYYPETCKCKLGKGLHNGVCYKFTSLTTKRCTKRKCKPSYICIDGATSGTTCVRKIVKSMILPNGDGTCSKKHVTFYTYVPYTD